MYDWPEAKAENANLWQAVRNALSERADVLPENALPAYALPDSLEEITDQTLDAHWQTPDLLFSQSCWGPLKAGCLAYLQPVAQPCYSRFEGGRQQMYRSAIIARDGAAAPVPDQSHATDLEGILRGRRFGYNHAASLSGLLALAEDLQIDAQDLQESGIRTGSHRASVRRLAEGAIDIAAIDCRSWAMARIFEPAARHCTVIGWTSERLGLPYVTSRQTAPALKAALTDALMNNGCYEVAGDAALTSL